MHELRTKGKLSLSVATAATLRQVVVGLGGQRWDNAQPPIWNTLGGRWGTVKIYLGSEIRSVDFYFLNEGAFPCDWGPLWVLLGMGIAWPCGTKNNNLGHITLWGT